MYSTECWPASKEANMRLSVMETKVLHWTAGVMHLDRIRNEAIQQEFHVAAIIVITIFIFIYYLGQPIRGRMQCDRKQHA